MPITFTGFIDAITLKTSVTHGPSGNTLITVPPIDNGGDGSTFSPTDLCSASVAACSITIMALYAKRQNINLKSVHFEMEKMMSANPRRISTLKLNFKVDMEGSEQDYQKLIEQAKTCPVRLSLSTDVSIEEHFSRL